MTNTNNISERLKDAFDLKTVSFLSGSGAYFAGFNWDILISRSVGTITIVLGVCKLIEMFTGKKLSELIKQKK